MSDTIGATLAFEQVQLPGGERHGSGLREVSFQVGPGELMLIESERREPCHVLFEAAMGQAELGAGKVHYRGTPWSAMRADEVVTARAGIGRVFAGPAWISNLNVDENILLAARHHRQATDADLQERAQTLAASWGMPELPRTRPSWIPPRDLQRAQWVRALLVPRSLLLLQLPDEEVTPEDMEGLLATLREEREKGVSVVCLTAEPNEWNKESITPGLHFKLQGAELVKINV